MKLLVILAFLFVFLGESICNGSTLDAFAPSISAPVSLPADLAISPTSTSMPAFSPGIQAGPERDNLDTHKKMIIAVVACMVVAAIIFCVVGFWIYHRKFSPKSYRNARSKDAEKGLSLAPFFDKIDSVKVVGKKGSVPLIDYKQLEKATENFQESKILGEGAFGCVYKAQLDDNLQVAVKKLNCDSPDAEREFENEVELLSRIHHPNVISLLGCSSHCDSRFIVYELMQNGSLETLLHGASHGSALTWHMRMKIALDTARGLEYLHEHCSPTVIHRDLKSSNILLDSNFNAKLSDFGLAVTDGSQNSGNLKLSGTLGYVAPEYLLDAVVQLGFLAVNGLGHLKSFLGFSDAAITISSKQAHNASVSGEYNKTGKLTDKSDVYAFGVVLLELLLGKRPVEKLAPAQCQSIVTWAMPQLTDRSKLPNILDPVIKDTMDLKHLYQVAAVAVLCVQPEPSYRPLITDVLHSLIPLVPVELGGTLRVTQAAVAALPAPPVPPPAGY